MRKDWIIMTLICSCSQNISSSSTLISMYECSVGIMQMGKIEEAAGFSGSQLQSGEGLEMELVLCLIPLEEGRRGSRALLMHQQS